MWSFQGKITFLPSILRPGQTLTTFQRNTFGHSVAMWCNMLDQIWKCSNFSCNILDVAWCCTCLARFTQHCWLRACALGPLVARQGPRAHKHRHVALKMFKMLHAFGHPVEHMPQHHAKILPDVALKCCERLARPLHCLQSFVHWSANWESHLWIAHLCPEMQIDRCTPNFDIQHQVSL